eukprot:TRINITY_DN336_c0_g2_i1.p1 TRINITY_DN336_c0_g2~~TRINITY_DN336_c0_g2_i1.p1  ORF type:complete len:357 (-),score=67.33 TRINITY_DN336_c0_g2_i1:259-1281(-)
MPAVVVPFEGGSFRIHAHGRPGIDKVFEPLRHLDCRRSSVSVLRSSLTEIALDNRLSGNASFRCMSSAIPNNCNIEPDSGSLNPEDQVSFFVDLTSRTVHRIGKEVVPLSSTRPTKKTKLSVESRLKADRVLAEVIIPGEGLEVELSVEPSKRWLSRNTYTISIKTLTGKTITIGSRQHNMTVLSLKETIQDIEGIPVSQQKLIFDGKQLEENRTLGDYDLQEGTVVHLVLRLRGGMHHMTSGNKDYCSLSITSQIRPGAHTVCPCTVMYLAGDVQKSTTAFVSKSLTSDKLLAMVEMETDPTFFTSLTLSQLNAIPQGAVETLSRAALVRMNRALAEAA